MDLHICMCVTSGMLVQVGKSDKPGALDDPTRPYIKFDIITHLDTLSSHEHKRVCFSDLSVFL